MGKKKQITRLGILAMTDTDTKNPDAERQAAIEDLDKIAKCP